MRAGKPDPSVARTGALEDLRKDHWIVPLGRRVIEAHSNAYDFGAVIAFAAVGAWRDRGKGWGHSEGEDFKRESAQTPPGGWPQLAGVAAPTWRRWRDRAIQIGLIERRHGEYANGREIALLCPREKVGEGEQFARVPVAVLFDPGLSRTAKRCYVAVAMYRNKAGSVSAAVATIGTLAGINDRNVKRGLRELERVGALIASADARTGSPRRWVMPDKWELNVSATPTERQRHPYGTSAPPLPERGRHPIKNILQESESGICSGDSGPSPGSTLIDDPEVRKEPPPQDDGQGKAAQAPPLTMPLVGEAVPPKKDWPLPAYTGGAKGRLKAIAERAVEIIDHEGTSAAEAETAIAQLVECHALLNGQAA